MTTRKTATREREQTEATPEATSEAAPETAVETLTREASEHAAFLQKVRERTLEFCSNVGICSGGQTAFLNDVGIPNNPSSRREHRQPAIAPNTLGVDPSWLTEAGAAAALEQQRAANKAQRDKIARGIVRGAALGYYTSDSANGEMTALGLEHPAQVTNGSIYLNRIYFEGLPEDVTSEQVSEAFTRVLSAAIGTYLPGWQHPTVTAPEVTTNKSYVVSDVEDNWSF